MNIPKTVTHVLLAAAGLAFWGQSAQAAAPLAYAPGDLLLSFQASADPGNNRNYVVNIGAYTQFLDPDTQTTVVNLGNVGADLTQFFGANWQSRTDLKWSVVGTSAAPGQSPVLFATRERASSSVVATAWTGQAPSGQNPTAALIRTFGYEYRNIGGTAQGVRTSGSPFGVSQDVEGVNSYSQFIIPKASADFNTWSTIQGKPASILDIFQVNPVYNQTATRLGYFYLHANGSLIFVGANVLTPDTPYFPETVAPVINLAGTPKAGAKLTSAAQTFTGSVVETGSGLDSLSYTLNGGSPQSIAFTGSSPFALSAPINLVPGPNTLVFTAVDVDGNIGTATRQVFYNVPVTNPAGLIEQSPNGTIALPKGALNQGYSYTLTAKPGAGYIVEQWYKNGVAISGASGNSLAITAQDGDEYSASFVANFYPNLVGAYPGIFGNARIADTTPASFAAYNLTNGGTTFNLTSTGAFTGTVTIGGKAIPVKGTFNGLKTATVTAAGLALDLTIDNTDPTYAFISGTATYNGGSAVTLKSYRSTPYTGKGTNVSPLNGKRFSIALQREASDSVSDPKLGHGFASVAIGKTGLATVSGQLADGTAFTVNVPVVEKGGTPAVYSLPVSRQLAKGNTGLLHGELLITDDGDATTRDVIEANSAAPYYGLGWLRAASSTPSAAFSSGILRNLGAVGSQWILPAGNSLLTGNSKLALFSLTLDAENVVDLNVSTDYYGYWPSTNAPGINGLPKGTTFKFVAATGAFSGVTTKSVTVSGKTKVVTVPYQGLVLPDRVEINPNPELNGIGYLLYGSSSGKVEVGENVVSAP